MTDNTDPIASGSRLMLPAEKRGRQLVDWVKAAQWRDQNDWYAALEASDTRELIAAIGGLSGDSRSESFREAAQAMVEQKLTDRMFEQMERLERRTEQLERASCRLGWIAVGVAVILGLVELAGR